MRAHHQKAHMSRFWERILRQGGQAWKGMGEFEWVMWRERSGRYRVSRSMYCRA